LRALAETLEIYRELPPIPACEVAPYLELMPGVNAFLDGFALISSSLTTGAMYARR